MLQIQLSRQEKKVLAEFLKESISDLGMEIADTDRQDFREQIKGRRDVLARLLAVVEKSDASPSPQI